MTNGPAIPAFDDWMTALEARHLAALTPAEVARALRALSSCYVERRGRLAEGHALAGAGKRAAFALFYAPLHFVITRRVVGELHPGGRGLTSLHDLGCGTGAAGAAWALAVPGVRVTGVDRHPWAVAEANWTYRQLGVGGRAVQGDIARLKLPARPGLGVLAAYTMNELSDQARGHMLARLLQARRAGALVLIIEPVARRLSPWWSAWAEAFRAEGGRDDEWRFSAELPQRTRALGTAAGLRLRELTARTLFAGPSA